MDYNTGSAAHLRRWVILATLLASLSAPARAWAQDGAEETPEEGYFRSHLWHWVISLGVNTVGDEFASRAGTSAEPLFFADPPGLDRWARDGLRDEGFEKNYILQRRSAIALSLGAGTIFLANVGRERGWRWMAEDATGLAELWFFEKGTTEIVKHVAGRQRPTLEFADEDPDLTPQERAELEADENEHHSFYSGAAARQFALMSYCDRIVAGRVKSRAARIASFVGFYGFASYVGWSRIAGDDHYLTDVMAGAAAGIVSARGFYRAHHPAAARGAREVEPPRISFHTIRPVPGGAAILFAVRP